MSTIVIVAGGDRVDQGLLEELPSPDRVLAADGGYHTAIALGLAVDVIVGDFDSLSPDFPIPDTVQKIEHPIDKDSTDLELAFELACGDRPARIVLVGGEGGRFDHELGAAAVLGSSRWSDVAEIEWVRTDAHIYVVRGAVRVHGDPGGYLSLFAVGGDANGVTTQGLIWPLRAETLYSGSSRGVSNQFSAPEATIRVENGALLVVVPVMV